MARYTDLDALSRIIKLAWDTSDSEDFEKSVFIALGTAPTADVVDKERFDRLLESSIIISDALNKYQNADMVEVVRCKDCKWYEEQDETIGTCLLVEAGARIDGFCAWGERREDVEETD